MARLTIGAQQQESRVSLPALPLISNLNMGVCRTPAPRGQHGAGGAVARSRLWGLPTLNHGSEAPPTRGADHATPVGRFG
jgi:hypothetical protein